MAKPILISKSNHIGDHCIVDEIGLIKATHPKYTGESLGDSILDALTLGQAYPDYWENESEALERLKRIARKRGANGIISVRYSRDCNHGYYQARGVAVVVKGRKI